MRKLFSCFILALISHTSATLLDLDIMSTVQFTRRFTDLAIYNKRVNILKEFILNISKEEKNLAVHYIGMIDKEIQEIFSKTNLIKPSNEVVIEGDQREQDLGNLIVSIADYFSIIQNSFHIFIDKLKKNPHSSELCLIPWADGIPQGTNLVDSLNSMKQVTSGVNFISLFNDILVTFRSNGGLVKKYCNKNITVPDKLISIYHFIAAIDRKYFIMESFVQLIRSACHNDTNTYNLLVARELLIIKTQKYLEILKNTILQSERSLYNCNRNKNSLTGQHYIELEGFKRTVVINKRSSSVKNTCIPACSHIDDENPSISYADFMARREYCPGRLANCESGGDIELCHAVPESPRLYEWIKKNSTGEVYGKFSECSGSIEVMKRYQYELYSSFYCEPCICTCIQDTDFLSSRLGVSLKEELADIQNNEVITGIRFSKKGKIIHPQIKTGKLLPEGRIQEFTNKWKPVNSIASINNVLPVFSETKQQEFVYFGGSSEDVQYFNLEQIFLTDEYVMTGMKFILVKKDPLCTNEKVSGNSISIAIQATHYNIKTGKLGKYPSNWIIVDPIKEENPYRTCPHRRELKFLKSENPLKYDVFNSYSTNGDYIGFWPSDLKKDAGQTTVPFIDATPVCGIPSFPLGGIGLYHKGLMDSAGYIAFKVTGVDYSQYINAVIPSDETFRFINIANK